MQKKWRNRGTGGWRPGACSNPAPDFWPLFFSFWTQRGTPVSRLKPLASVFWALVAVGIGMGCGDDRVSSPSDASTLHDLRIVSGNNQAGQVGEELKQPLVIEAVTRQGLVLRGVEVKFSVEAGGGGLSGTTVVTEDNGRAQTRLTLGLTPGTNRVAATVSGLSGLTPTFTATAEGEAVEGGAPTGPGGPPDADRFSLSANPVNLPGRVVFGLESTVTAFVFDASSNPVRTGTTVRFRTSHGGIEGSARTDAQGRATAQLTTAGPVPKDGRVTVTAETVSGKDTLRVETEVVFSGPTVIELLKPPNFSVAPGESQTFEFSVGDSNRNPLSESTRISVRAEGGTVSGDTDIRLLDTKSPQDARFSVLFQASRTGAAPRMTIDVISPNGNQMRSFGSGAGGTQEGEVSRLPDTIFVEVEDSVLVADGISTTTVAATVLDSSGIGVPDAIVSFSVEAGPGAVDATDLTDAAGRASATYRSILDTSGVPGVTVEARTGALAPAKATLRLRGVRMGLSVSKDTIDADGNAQSTITVRLQSVDSVDSIAIPNAIVRFETTLGTLSSTLVETDGEGIAETILVAGTQAGKAVVTATYGAGLRDRASVAFVKGPPASIVIVSVQPPSIGVQGAGANETAIITFEVRDARGNTVKDGEPILFRLDVPVSGGERVGPDSTGTVNGRVQAAVNGGTVARTVRLIAEAPLAAGDTVRSIPVPIAIHGGPPAEDHFSLAAEPVNLAGRVRLGLRSTISAFVFDKFSNPVPEGTSVRFRTNFGGVQGSAETDTVGQGSVILFTAAPVPTEQPFLATITGQTIDENGREIEARTTVLFSGPTAPIELDVDSIRAGSLFIPDGGDQIITFTVSDITGLPLMGGSTIQVTSDVARISGNANVTIPDVRSGHTGFSITVSDPVPREDPSLAPQRGLVLIQVRSLNGDEQFTFGLTVD